MKKSTLIMILSLVLAVAIGVGSTMAYLQATDEDVNVMTLGSVYITQNEQERDADGNLVPFTPNKPAYPAVGPIDWADEGVVVNGTEYKVFTDELQNVVDKIVTVTNTGKSDAYIRTIIAIEAPDYDPADLIHINYNDTGVVISAPVCFTRDGVDYVCFCFTYADALAPQETSAPSLVQLFLDSDVTNADVEKFGETWEVLVLSQAVQTQGFADAETALNTAFEAVTSAKVAEWFGGDFGKNIGSPGNKNDTNNPPEFFPTTSWQKEGNPDTSWYNDTDTEFVIDTEEEFAGFAKLVNDGNTFSKKTVKLGADLDLSAHNWVPIGKSQKQFQGTFDGQGNTISNLIAIHEGVSDIGLFGMTSNGTVKNFTVDNATVTGYLDVGVVAGTPYTTKYSDITLTGLIRVDGFSYVGGLGGKNAYANINNITINAKSGSYVKANSVDKNGTAYRTYVGGVIGFMGEGGHTVTDVTSNINVYGSTIDVGGITGIAHYGNSFINCSSSGDVYITDATEAADVEEMGGIAGVWHNHSNVTFDGCSFTGTLNANIAEGVDLSDNTIVGNAYSATGTGELIIK